MLMSSTFTASALPVTLLDRLTVSSPLARLLAVVGVATLTAVASQISVPLPFTPVPLTLQPMVVLLGGAVLGARLGAASQCLYLMAGLAGLPVFALSGDLSMGLLRLVGPTGGYLMAYPLAAALVGALAARGLDRRVGGAVLAMLAGLAVIFVGGVTWLAKDAGLPTALALGLYPFVLVDVLKVAAAATLLPSAWRLLGSRGE
jgi:biotin transport system substrate-specific component